jgi:hypothetical protein
MAQAQKIAAAILVDAFTTTSLFTLSLTTTPTTLHHGHPLSPLPPATDATVDQLTVVIDDATIESEEEGQAPELTPHDVICSRRKVA